MNEVIYKNLKFTVLNVEDRRIGKIRVEILPLDESENEEEDD
jgi:CBS domain containing-hemolysin-like protein